MQLRKGTLPLVGIVVLALITFAVVFAFFSGLSRSVEVVAVADRLASVPSSPAQASTPRTPEAAWRLEAPVVEMTGVRPAQPAVALQLVHSA